MNPIDFYSFKVKIHKYNRLAIKYDVGLRKCWHLHQFGDRLYDRPEMYLTMDNQHMHSYNFYVDYCFEYLEFNSMVKSYIRLLGFRR